MKITPPKVAELKITGAALRSVQAADEKAEHFYKVANELSAKLFARLQKEESCALDLRLAYEAWREFDSHWQTKSSLVPRWEAYDYSIDRMSSEWFRDVLNFHTCVTSNVKKILEDSKRRLIRKWEAAGISVPKRDNDAVDTIISWLKDCEAMGL